MPKVINASAEIVNTDEMSRLTMMELAGRICYKSEDKITDVTAVDFVADVLKKKHWSVSEFAVFTLFIIAPNKIINNFLILENDYLTVDVLGKKGMYVTGTARALREAYQKNDNDILNAIITFLKLDHPEFFGIFADTIGNLRVVCELLSSKDVDKLPVELLKRHRWAMAKYTVNRAVSHELVRHRPCSWLQESQRYCRYDDDKFNNEVTFIRPSAFSAITDNPDALRLWRDAIISSEAYYLALLGIGGVSPQAARTTLVNSCKTELYQWCNLAEYEIFFGLRDSPKAEPSMREVVTPLHDEVKNRFPTVFKD